MEAGGGPDRKWQLRLLHGYANRKFPKKMKSLMHRLGEELEYPAYNPGFAERLEPTADAVRKLAQQMEMVVIWINRKQVNEVNLLS